MKIIRKLLIVNLLFFGVFQLEGCATTGISKGYSLARHPGEGLVVVSVTHDKEGWQYCTSKFYIAEGAPESNAGGFGSTWIESRQYDALGTAIPDTDFEDVFGQLLVINLPAGEYSFFRWTIFNRYGVTIGPSNEPKPLGFTVHAGKVIYIGNLHMRLERRGESATFTVSGWPEIRNAWGRDQRVLRKKFPSLAGAVIVEPLTTGVWFTQPR